MPELVLAGKGQKDYFPRPIVRLYEFLLRNPRFWRVVADFMVSTKLSANLNEWNEEYDRLVRLYSLARHPEREDLRQILMAIDSLKLNESPRGRALEYIVFRLSPFFTGTEGSTEVQCALFWDEGKGSRVPVAPTPATFDVATLSETEFEAFECKLTVNNFLYYGDRVRSEAVGKLRFMLFSDHAVQSTGRKSQVYFIGLDARPHELQDKLKRCGHRYVQVFGARDIEKRLSA